MHLADLDAARTLGTARALVVDWDGTVADTHERNFRALNDALGPYGVTVNRAWYRKHAGLAVADLLAALAALGGSHAPPLPKDEIIRASRSCLLAATSQLRPIPATVGLLRAARRRALPCAVASGAARDLVMPGIRALCLEARSARW